MFKIGDRCSEKTVPFFVVTDGVAELFPEQALCACTKGTRLVYSNDSLHLSLVPRAMEDLYGPLPLGALLFLL